QRLHLLAPFLALVRLAHRAQVLQAAQNFGEPLQVGIVGRGRAFRLLLCSERSGETEQDRAGGQECFENGWHGRARYAPADHGPQADQPTSLAAASTISSRPSVVFRPVRSAGAIQRASSNSSFRLISPPTRRAAKQRMTKCRFTRLSSSRRITSRWPASATGSISSAVSSRTSRATASRSVSPASTTPPGTV